MRVSSLAWSLLNQNPERQFCLRANGSKRATVFASCTHWSREGLELRDDISGKADLRAIFNHMTGRRRRPTNLKRTATVPVPYRYPAVPSSSWYKQEGCTSTSTEPYE